MFVVQVAYKAFGVKHNGKFFLEGGKRLKITRLPYAYFEKNIAAAISNTTFVPNVQRRRGKGLKI